MANDSARLETPVQEVNLPEVPLGRVVDVGGGGEGIVSRLAEGRVCVVDTSLSKIREARIYGAAAEWFVGDGKSLPFGNSTFDAATLWFSLAYMGGQEDKELALRETSRVLRAAGSLSILGIVVDDSCEAVTFNGRFIYPDGYVSKMSYRVKGKVRNDHQVIGRILRKAGFEVASAEDNVYWFEIDALKR